MTSNDAAVVSPSSDIGPGRGRALTTALTVIVLVALTATLTLPFRRDPNDIKSGSVGKPAPTFTLDLLEGSGRLSLDDYRGRVIVLNVWASWCVPCKQENPALSAIWERYGSSPDFIMIGIVYQDTVEAAREYDRRMGNTWPSVVDPDGRTAFAYGVFGIPETFFISRDGLVAGRHVGAIDQGTLAKGIDALRVPH